MNQTGLIAGLTVGATVLLAYALLQRVARAAKSDRRGEAANGDGGSAGFGAGDGCAPSDSKGSCDDDAGGGDAGGGDGGGGD